MGRNAIWESEIDVIKNFLKEEKTLEEIGEHYAVSKQRIYQVLTKYGIQTPSRKVKNFLRDKTPEQYWLNKILCNKGFNKKERMELINKLEIPTHCPVLGIKLNFNSKLAGWRNEESPSIDRINSAKGYTIDNIAIISWRANRLKNNGTAEEHKKIYTWMKENNVA